jgi:hypothetical protein
MGRKDNRERHRGVGYRSFAMLGQSCPESTFRHLYVESLTHQTDPMDEIEELRRALGPVAKDYNDTQLRQLSRELNLAAEFLLDLYVARRSGKTSVETAGFDTSGSEPVA